MRVILVVVALTLLVCFVYWAEGAIRRRNARLRMERLDRVGWSAEPRTLPNGDRQVWLVRPGYPDWLYRTVECRDGVVNETSWDSAKYDAELEAMEWDRLTGKIGGRHIPGPITKEET